MFRPVFPSTGLNTVVGSFGGASVGITGSISVFCCGLGRLTKRGRGFVVSFFVSAVEVTAAVFACAFALCEEAVGGAEAVGEEVVFVGAEAA